MSIPITRPFFAGAVPPRPLLRFQSATPCSDARFVIQVSDTACFSPKPDQDKHLKHLVSALQWTFAGLGKPFEVLPLLTPSAQQADETWQELNQPENMRQFSQFEQFTPFKAVSEQLSQLDVVQHFGTHSSVYVLGDPHEPKLFSTYIELNADLDLGEPNHERFRENVYVLIRPLSRPAEKARQFSIVYLNNEGRPVQSAVRSLDGSLSMPDVQQETQDTLNAFLAWMDDWQPDLD